MKAFRAFAPVIQFIAALVALPPALAATAQKPNIVVLLADDLGWGDCTFQGINFDVPTPNVDKIAAGGVRFTNGYVSATYCSPSRAGLMTGRYPTRFGFEFIGAGPGVGLPPSERTMADDLKALGYATGAVGKWHLGEEPGMYPTDRGFDEYMGVLSNPGSYFHPGKWMDSLHQVASGGKDFYTTEVFATRAVDFIKRNKDHPFFLYLPFNAEHMPLDAPERYTSRFPNIADEKHRTFAGMLSAMDDAIGKVMATLHEYNLEENTIVVFFSDNGGATQTTTSNGPLRGHKSTTSEGGTRIPFAIQWKGHITPGQVFNNPMIQLDLLPTFVTAAGGEVDPKWKIDGVDLMPYLTGKNTERPHQTLYWKFGEQWAIREGDWKLVVSSIDRNRPRLINLANDLSEANDLSATEPERVKALTAKWQAWNAEQHVALWGPADEDGPAKKAKKKAGKG